MDKLREWRSREGLTATQAAELAGVSQAQWTRYETGQRAIAPTRVAAISKITGIPARELRPDIFEAAQ